MKWRHDPPGACVGVPDSAPSLQTLQNAGRNLGDPQNENIEVREGLMEEDGPSAAVEK